MGERDQYDLAISTESPEAANAWREAIERLCALQEPLAALRRALAADPGFALPAVHLANLLRQGGDAAGAARVLNDVDLARTTPREAANVGVIHLLLAGRVGDALGRIEAILAEYPTDAPLLNLAHRLYVNTCPSPDRRHRHHGVVKAVFARYPSDDWYAMSELAYSSEEVDDLAAARVLGEKALAVNPNSGEAAHALAHVAYEQSDAELAARMERWVDEWEQPSAFISHLLWHAALAAVAAGEPERALAIMSRAETEHPAAPPALRLLNWASLLWRLHLDGVERLPWANLVDLRSPPGFVFAECHEAMVLAALGDEVGLTRLLHRQRERAEAGHPAASVATAVVEAMAHLAARRGSEAVALLEPVLPEATVLGGSRAQQEVFEDSLLAAYVVAGRHAAAVELLQARYDRRPSKRDNAWLQRIAGSERGT